MTVRPSYVALGAVLTFGILATPLLAQGNLGNPAALTEQAPATYKARFDTSKGVFVIDVRREWAPLGADRFFRVISGFMVQFGINGIRRSRHRGALRSSGTIRSSRATSAATSPSRLRA